MVGKLSSLERIDRKKDLIIENIRLRHHARIFSAGSEHIRL